MLVCTFSARFKFYPSSLIQKLSSQQFSVARNLHESDNESMKLATSATEVDPGKNKEPESSSLSQNSISHSHRKAFCKWATTKGLVHRDAPQQPGTNYLDGKSHPFPLNPQFQPKPPISSETRVRVYDDWKSGLGIQQLSMKYSISLQRVEAILKLQQVSIRWTTEGRNLMSSYSQAMSTMLGAVDHDAVGYEQVADVPIDPGRQLFTLVPEAVEYTSKDAANDLGKVPFAERTERYIQSFLKRSTFEHRSAFARLTKRDEGYVSLQDPCPIIQGRISYTVRDTHKNRTMLRNKDGSLMLHTVRTDFPQQRNAQSKWHSH